MTMMKHKLLFILFVLIYIPVSAQLSCSFKHYSSENGLSQNTVMSMLQDHKGMLWLATWDGINKFNGYNFKTYKARQGNLVSLTNNRADYMAEDSYGYIWILTYDNRAHRFNPSTEIFEQVPASGEGSAFNIVSIEVMPQGSVWLLTENEGAIRVTTNKDTHKLSTDIYSSKSGLLPAQKVLKVCQDKALNEWLLTDNGLAMIRLNEKPPILYFAETKDGNEHNLQTFYSFQELGNEIFFGSDKGRVWYYQKKHERFQLLELPVKSNIIGVNSVSDNELVITTRNEGFYTYNLTTKEIKSYNKATCKNFPAYKLMSTYVDKQNEVWFELNQPGGVCHFNPSTKLLTYEVMLIEPGSAARSEPAFHIHEDVNGRLWVHPFGGGFSYFDRERNKLIPFYNKLDSPDWKFSNKLHSTLSDRQGNLWICTHSKGLEKVSFIDNDFKLEVPYPHDYESLSNEVRALYVDKDQNLWVSVKEGIIRIYNSEKEYIGYLTQSGTIAKSGPYMTGVAYCITQDSEGVMWIATKGDGLVRAEKSGNGYKLTRYKHNEDDIYSLSDDNIYCAYQDGKGRIWLATFGGGLNYIDKDDKGHVIFINHRNNLKGYPIDRCHRVRHITSDNKGHIWIGTTTGALCFNENFKNPEEVMFRHYFRIPSDVNSLSNNDVHWVISTKNKEIYLATFGGGLNKLISMDDEGGAVFKSYTVKEGAPSDVMLSVQEDRKGNLWISTENGLGKFIPSAEKFENYDESIFDFKARFNEGASAKLPNKDMFFGTSNGFLSFSPDSVHKSIYIPSVVFSKLMLSNVEVIPGEEGSVLKKTLDDTEKLILSHKENIFSIQYAALDMREPDNIHYAYLLDGFDQDWNYVDKQRVATYTNLPKGDYVLRVKSTNSDGVWIDNERTLRITVLPSFWETPWAIALYIIVILAIILVAVYILFTIFRLKHEVSVEQQVSDIKLRFFTNISHELRTPLTLIAGPVEYVLKNSKLPDDARDQLQVVERNTDRMLRLVNQILDFRKIQNRKMKMQVQEIDVVPFVRRIMDNFEAMAEEHHIDFVFESETSGLRLWVDADKLEKIVFNLLSNAFKYTPQGKMITVFIHEDEKTVALGVQDQGIGIAENKKGSLFVRFENLMDKNLFNQNSSGIGLSLVKELVELHKAMIHVDSKLGEGSCFTVNFGKGKKHYDESVEFILADTDTPYVVEKAVDVKVTVPNNEDEPIDLIDEVGKQKNTMLLIEDNLELRFFLRSIFSSDYRVIEAADGVEGWNKALKFIPDIIISDVMMPEKDGIALTKELRDNIITSHIPIVLLTAKTAIESKLEGLEFGADDYITKPFSSTYLKARVENLLSQRRKLQEIYRANLLNVTASEKEVSAQPEMSSSDRKFMDKLLELMEKNIDNGDMVVDDLVQDLAVSRSVFFKKLKTLTGLAPIEFIKEIRVKRAAQLIETGEFNMTQISYMVGINDPRYFSKCFKQKFGITPTEYKDKVTHL